MLSVILQYPWDFLRPLVDFAAAVDIYVKFAVFALAVAILAISVLAFRKARSRRLLFVTVAFFLFAVKWGIKILDIYFSPGNFLADTSENIFEFSILALLFFAIFRK